MLVFPDFCFVHIPKMGGTFIKKCLLDLFWQQRFELCPVISATKWKYAFLSAIGSLPDLPCETWKDKLWRIDGGVTACRKRFRQPEYYVTTHPHALLCGLWRQVEPRRVLASIRSPMSYYSSLFHYGRREGKVNVDFPEFFANCDLRMKINWCCLYQNTKSGALFDEGWNKSKGPLLVKAGLADTWNREPDLEMLARLHDCYPDTPEMRHPIGFMSFALICFLFKDPVSVLSKEPEDFNRFFSGDAWRQELPPIDFLHLDNINRGLYDYLERRGYRPPRTMLKKERVNASTAESFDPSSMFGPVERRLLNEREWIPRLWFPRYFAAPASGEAVADPASKRLTTADA